MVEDAERLVHAFAELIGLPVIELADLERLVGVRSLPNLDRLAVHAIGAAEAAASDLDLGALIEAHHRKAPPTGPVAVLGGHELGIRSVVACLAFAAARRVAERHAREHGSAFIRSILSPDLLDHRPERSVDAMNGG